MGLRAIVPVRFFNTEPDGFSLTSLFVMRRLENFGCLTSRLAFCYISHLVCHWLCQCFERSSRVRKRTGKSSGTRS